MFILGNTPVSAEETDASMEESQPDVTIYDNEGNLVEPDEMHTNEITPAAATLPTKIKTLNNSQLSYLISNYFVISNYIFII